MRRITFALGLLACAPTTTGTPGTTGDTATTAPPPTQQEVEDTIDAANTCAAATDCVDLGAQCPFGCWILVNAAEAEAVQAAIDAFYAGAGSTCTYSCMNRGPIECRAGKCEADATY